MSFSLVRPPRTQAFIQRWRWRRRRRGRGRTIGYNVISSTGLRRGEVEREDIVSNLRTNQEFHSEKPKRNIIGTS